MKKFLALPIALAVSLGAAMPIAPASAEPGGCLKYGAAGAVGGHLAHHGVLGAAGGCATGMYVRHRYRKQQRHDAAAYRQGQTQQNANPQYQNGNQDQSTNNQLR
jgi:hypothetical protein